MNLDGFNTQDNFILITQSEAKDVDEDKILFETDDPEMARRMCACLSQLPTAESVGLWENR